MFDATISQIAKKLDAYLKNCHICKLTNPVPKPKFQMKTIPPSAPMRDLSIDFLGPLKSTGSLGQKFILNVIDNATRFIFPIPMKTQQIEETIDALTTQIFMKFGFPSTIRSDNVGNFRSNLLKDYLEKLNIQMVKSTPYYSKSNAPVERSLRTIQSSINKLINMTNCEWVTYIPYVAYTYNNSYIESLKSIPFELMFGRNPNISMDLFLRKYNAYTIDKDLTTIEIQERLAVARELAAENYKEFRNLKNSAIPAVEPQIFEPNT
uniref:Integrase catalytic domain-containing protein n=1 Tax=Parastrongyloides trichosuri TaxID=131310 RepID=A0A0N4ZDA3_PARTI